LIPFFLLFSWSFSSTYPFPSHIGPYPAAQTIPIDTRIDRKSNVHTGAIVWGAKRWASVLNFAKFLHINVAGNNTNDKQQIEKIVKKLKLKNDYKIVYNFNETIDRATWMYSAPDVQAGIVQLE
jgi:hypothetical protein